jgi:hypothetical protein
MKGVQLVYDFATFRRPSQMVGEPGGGAPIARPEDVELQVPLNPQQQQQQQQPPNLPLDGHEPPGTPAISTFEVDDEFNLPISVAIVILLIYIFVGAIIYWTWENWGFFESFYFVFISMSTIGFGDFVPQVGLVTVLRVLLCAAQRNVSFSSMHVHTEERDVYNCHHEISGYYSNQLSSVNMLHGRQLHNRSRKIRCIVSILRVLTL